MSDNDTDTPTTHWNATLQITTTEEHLALDLPFWMDKWDARDEFHTEAMNVYGHRGTILQLNQA